MLTIEQHATVYELLASEVDKARRAVAKAERAYEEAPYEFAGISTERSATFAILEIRKAQYRAAYDAAAEYFDRHINV